MATDREQIRSYVESSTKTKFKHICQLDNRSESNMVETLVLNYIKAYEAEHGEIQIEEK